MITGYSNIISVTTLPALLLDAYPSAAVAYSLRKLRTAYTGSAIRVRNASNAEQDIGFTALGNLDTTALLSHCGSGNGFVTTWYDQSGNSRDATQSTAAKQPQIVSSGSVLTTNSKPAITWSGGSNYSLRTSLFTPILQPSTYFITAQIDARIETSLVDGAITNGEFIIFRGSNANGINYAAGSTIVDSSVPSTQLLFSILVNTTSSEIYNNNVLESSGNMGTNTISGFSLGNLNLSNETAGYQLRGAYQEFVFYPSNQSTNNTAINTNINSYYAIY